MVYGYLARKIALLQRSTISQSLSAFTDITHLKRTHALIITSGFSKDIFVISRLLVFAAISDYADLNYAKTLFENVQHPTLFMYNTVIRAFSQSNQPLDSIEFYVEMLRSGVSPDNFTYPFLIRSCSVSTLFVLGRQFHSHVLKFGLDSDVFIVNNTISMYSNCGRLNDARRLFHESLCVVDVVSWTALVTGYSNSGEIDVARQFFDLMPCRNIVSWNAMIAGYAQCRKIDIARKLFDEMPQRNVASWSTMISGYSQCGMCQEAVGLFQEMIKLQIAPNEAALVSLVSACAQQRELEQGVWLHGYIEEHKFEVNVTLGTALVDMYGKCGDAKKALNVFNEMPVKNVMSWNSMIAGLALSGHGKQALSLFLRMLKMGPTPNDITFIPVLSGCSHSGLVKEGRWVFDIMTRVYHIKPQLEHYGCIVDLLGRAGLIKEALDFVEGMPLEPHPGLWGALVGACRIHGDIKLGEELGKHLIKLEPHHSGRYVLLSNILASAKRWDDVAMVRNLLKERKVFKTPGNSIVEA